MGREIRKVIPNWEHPKNHNGNFQPMFDESYEDACQKWTSGFKSWLDKTHPDYKEYSGEYQYWDWEGNPPNKDYYRPHWKDAEMTWIQLYETVSEGTPVSPPFATKEELVEYLVENGDFWCQKRGEQPPTKAQAEGLVDTGWAPSMIMAGGKMFNAFEQQDLK